LYIRFAFNNVLKTYKVLQKIVYIIDKSPYYKEIINVNDYRYNSFNKYIKNEFKKELYFLFTSNLKYEYNKIKLNLYEIYKLNYGNNISIYLDKKWKEYIFLNYNKILNTITVLEINTKFIKTI